LSHIKEVSAIVHLVRSFQNQNITHVENSIDPKRDIELINTELILKDLETVENKIKNLSGRVRANPKLKPISDFFELLYKHLSDGNLGLDLKSPNDEVIVQERKEMFLLTDKPVIYLVNAHESDAEESRKLIQSVVGDKTVLTMDVKLESELAEMQDDERAEFMKDLDMPETGLEMLTREAYKLLGLISFFTEGPEEVRAWTIKVGSDAPEAGAAIHTDFKTKFIAADVCTFSDYVSLGGWNKCKENGKLRLEGRDYIVADGDIMVFRHGS
jgi:ribosome-binding ATPase